MLCYVSLNNKESESNGGAQPVHGNRSVHTTVEGGRHSKAPQRQQQAAQQFKFVHHVGAAQQPLLGSMPGISTCRRACPPPPHIPDSRGTSKTRVVRRRARQGCRHAGQQQLLREPKGGGTHTTPETHLVTHAPAGRARQRGPYLSSLPPTAAAVAAAAGLVATQPSASPPPPHPPTHTHPPTPTLRRRPTRSRRPVKVVGAPVKRA